jgi:hypothetical protein
VSVNQIDYNIEKDRIEITNRIFIDDLNSSLQALTTAKFELEEMSSNAKLYTIFLDYYQKNFKIKVNQKDCIITIKSFEIEEDVFVIYGVIYNVSKIKSFELQNTLLFDLINSQQHIHHISIKNQKKSTLLDYNKRKTLLKY